ncbi:MAG: DUF1631 family protein [Proteobacteria bacterium]|nr:DUF1631 family protein [Pseudomonadota bacterium]
MLDLYTSDKHVDAGQPLQLSELLNYLKSADTSGMGPLEALLVQTEAMGDPALPSQEQIAILDWLNAAYSYWEQQFPIEQPLASELRSLLPLLGALAITDKSFLTPGAHSLHQLLDAVQASAVGWQARLGRAGQNLEREVGKAVARARDWFAEGSVDLAAINEDLITSLGKDRGRAQRMAQRAVEVEQGQMKTALVKIQAATMINALLLTHPAPPSIGEFLKGPWHDSAQLVLLRFGENSKEWAGMSATTEALLDSLQTEEAAPTDEEGAQGGSRRQQLFEAITKLPRELKRWLLSLAHDNHGVEEAIGIVEIAHMSVLRQQDLDAQTIEPIPVERAPAAADDPEVQKIIGALETDQWFAYLEEKSDPLRMQLKLKNGAGRQLFFTNQAGIKAMRISYADFARSLHEKRATPLYSKASFSRSLAHAAKLSTQADLKALGTQGTLQATQEHKASIKRDKEKDEVARQQSRREQEEEEQLRKEFDHSVQMQHERENAKSTATPKSAPGPQKNLSLKLSMGSWLGFHDGDKPLLAKLAAHDREHDKYIFVNRNGIKMRDLSREELHALMEKGQVEILESRSSFKEEDKHARSEYRD